MSNHWQRKYFILKTTTTSDVVGVASILCSENETSTFYFSLHRPENMHRGGAEFLDLNSQEIPYSEYETHKDVFETVEEVEILKTWTATTSMGVSILVQRAKK